MGVSKVVYGNDTLVDLTGDTVTPTSLTLGATAHGADGEPIVGEYQYVLPPMSSDIRGGARIQPDSGLEITDTDNLQVRLALESDGTVRGGIAELTAKGHAEQDGTPTPDNPVPIQVVTGHTVTGKTGRFVDLEVQGRNMFGGDAMKDVLLRKIPSASWSNDRQAVYFTAQNANNVVLFDDFKPNTAYTFVLSGKNTNDVANFANLEIKYTDGTITALLFATSGNYSTRIITSDSSKSIESLNGSWGTSATFLKVYESGVFEGALTVDDFEQYWHTTTALPLPSRGWVAGLPDGTADTLMLDGAGKCEWELVDSETTTAATDGITGMVGVDVLSTTGQIADGATVLYKLATPVTEDCGYVEDWPTDLPDGCVVSCPELDEVGIRYFIDSAVTELARQWYERAYAELGDAVTELAGRVAALES